MSAAEMLLSMRSDQFYRDAYDMLKREFEHLVDDNRALRRRVEQAEADVEGWRALAVNYGTTAEASKDSRGLHGEVHISGEMIALGGESAVVQACVKLSRTLWAKVPVRVARPSGGPTP